MNTSANKKNLNGYPECVKNDPSVMCKPMQVASSFVSAQDPDGSYTGTPVDGGMPVQDADDI
ncbi:hypothetical protein FACS1894133_4590 [Clostridia bacterium]|nr:hypothetical protein FACS1894133_4590 [Clostridia bacterium]